MSTSNKPHRRWLGFGLQIVFLLGLVIAASLGWAIFKTREQVALAALKEMAFDIRFDEGGFTENSSERPTVLERLRMLLREGKWRNVTSLYATRSSSKFTDAELIHVAALKQLKNLGLDYMPQVTDAGLAHLQGLNQLESLSLYGTRVTDAGLAHLGRLTQLKSLRLDRTYVTDAGLVHLAGLTQLEWLDLYDTRVTGTGLVHFQGLSQLKKLRLNGTQITDAELVHLQGLSQLNELDLSRTQVTDAGVRQLQKALPKCWIERSP